MARLNSGQTYTGQHLPNGVGTANCPGCSPGTWTCKGNQIFKSVNGMSYTGVLSPDGNTITEPYGTLTRVGSRRATVALESASGQLPSKQQRRAPDNAAQKKQSKASSGPALVPGLTQKECAARGGRITTYTNTAGRGPEVGECLVPAHIAGGAGGPPAQQGMPASASTAVVRAPTPTPQSPAEPAPQITSPPAASPSNPRVAAALGPVVSQNQNPPRSSSGASGAPPERQSEGVPAECAYASDVVLCWRYVDERRQRQNSDYCASANKVEKSSAYWGIMCVPETPEQAAQRNPERYYNKSPVSPNDLSKRADAACPLGERMNLRQQQQCVDNFKTDTVLREEPAVRAECAAIADRDRRAACAYVVYSYGPGSNENLKLVMRVMLGGRDPNPGTPWRPEPTPQEAVDGCPLGQGMLPTPDAFGAWSCQPLAQQMDWAKLGLQPADQAQEFEDRVNDIAALAATAAVKSADPRLPAPDRETCKKEASAAARALFKGGASPISPMCQDMVLAALHEVPFIAAGPVRRYNPGVDEVLNGYLTQRDAKSGGTLGGKLSPGLPGMVGLQPLGSTPQPPAAAPAAATSATSCAEAEQHWKSADSFGLIAAYQDHIERFPNCAFATLAKLKIEQIKKNTAK
jgi:hypothetical protein